MILEDDVVEAIDKVVGQRGRSRFLEEAAKEKLDRIELEQVIRDGAGRLKEKDYPHWQDQASINEWVQAQRRTEARS